MKFNLRNIAMMCAVLTGSYAAHGYERIDVWPDGAPTDNGYVVSDSDSERLNITTMPVLHLYPAADPVGKVVLMCPGGGYSHLAMEHEGAAFAPWFSRQGIDVAVLQYRMPNGHSEVPLDDARQAMRILRQRYPQAAIGIMGFSAGGHLASTAATRFTDSQTRPDFQILFYPVIMMSGPDSHEGSRNLLLGKDAAAEEIKAFDHQRNVTADTPPAFIVHSADDTTVPVSNSVKYFEALVANKVPAALHIYPTGEHGWGFYDTFKYKPQWQAELEYWLLHN